MNFQPIQSEANAKFKRWKRILESTRVMRKEGVTLAEGAHLVQVVLERGVKPLAVLLRAKGINEEAEGLLAKLAKASTALCFGYVALRPTLARGAWCRHHGGSGITRKSSSA